MSSQADSMRSRAGSLLREFIERLRQWSQRDVPIRYHVVVLIVLLLVALNLRLESVAHTEVVAPVRADAKDYFLYAFNTRYHGIYSRADTLFSNEAKPPSPDAHRVPLYPLFIAPFIDDPPLVANLEAIERAQALLSTLCIVLVFFLARRILPVPFALGVAGLTAISPHLVTSSVFLLTEALFAFVLVLAIYLVVKMVQERRVYRLWLTGSALAAAALTHPMVLYFVIPLGIFIAAVYPRHNRWKSAAILSLGFAIVYGPWVARNVYTLGAPGNGQLVVGTLHHGMYPDVMYQGDPASYGAPYRADPRSPEISRNLETVITEIVRRFREAPAEHLRWYILGKPTTLWSWGIIAGGGDVFAYPVISTPYSYLPHFQATHWLMRVIHWPLVVLMAIGVILAWLPERLTGLSTEAALGARIVSILLLYHTAVMMVGLPLPRYAIPMRPFMYLMSLLSILVVVRKLAAERLPDAIR